MLLIGMFDSPFVRRVAISMQRLAMPFEHCDWSVGRDADRIRAYNPLLRVPTLVLDDGEVLTESSAILDELDQRAGAARALLPVSGNRRREALQIMALAIGAAEKARDSVYERQFRPPEKQHRPWGERLESQVRGALGELERRVSLQSPEGWWVGNAMTQADITATCALTFVRDAMPLGLAVDWPGLEQRRQRCEAMPEFAATYTPFFAPQTAVVAKPPAMPR